MNTAVNVLPAVGFIVSTIQVNIQNTFKKNTLLTTIKTNVEVLVERRCINDLLHYMTYKMHQAPSKYSAVLLI